MSGIRVRPMVDVLAIGAVVLAAAALQGVSLRSMALIVTTILVAPAVTWLAPGPLSTASRPRWSAVILFLVGIVAVEAGLGVLRLAGLHRVDAEPSEVTYLSLAGVVCIGFGAIVWRSVTLEIVPPATRAPL